MNELLYNTLRFACMQGCKGGGAVAMRYNRC